MRRARHVLASMTVAAALAAATGCGSAARSTAGGKPTAGSREVFVPWALAAVRRGGRTLVLRYDASGCLLGDGRAVLAESAERVTIHVREHMVVPGSRIGAVRRICSDMILHRTLRVRLDEPLTGRVIAGGPRLDGVGIVR